MRERRSGRPVVCTHDTYLSRVSLFFRCTTEILKVGTASPLQVDVIRRLKTIALTSEASDSTAQGILAGLNKCEALFARIGTREGFREVLEVLEPLSDVVVLVKRAIRCVIFLCRYMRLLPAVMTSCTACLLMCCC